MATSLKSSKLNELEAAAGEAGSWLKVGAVAAASALAGGLLAAWWYRKTLHKLREADVDAQNPHFGISAEDQSDDI